MQSCYRKSWHPIVCLVEAVLTADFPKIVLAGQVYALSEELSLFFGGFTASNTGNVGVTIITHPFGNGEHTNYLW